MAEHKPQTRVIAVGNQKGGVGKTTNTAHLAAALGNLGNRVLIIDLDANCGVTQAFGLSKDWLGTFEVLLGDHEAKDLIVRTDKSEGISLPKNVELLPARRKLEEFEEVYRTRNKFIDPTATLAPVLETLMGDYDFIFLDTAPRADAPTVAAYRAADWFILSTEAAKLSVEGLTDALTDILAVREAGNEGLRLLGVVMCKVDIRTKVASLYMPRIRKEFEAAGELGAFDTIIGRTTDVQGAQDRGQTLFEFAPDHKVCAQFMSLAQEVLARLASAEQIDVEIKKPQEMKENAADA